MSLRTYVATVAIPVFVFKTDNCFLRSEQKQERFPGSLKKKLDVNHQGRNSCYNERNCSVNVNLHIRPGTTVRFVSATGLYNGQLSQTDFGIECHTKSGGGSRSMKGGAQCHKTSTTNTLQLFVSSYYNFGTVPRKFTHN